MAPVLSRPIPLSLFISILSIWAVFWFSLGIRSVRPSPPCPACLVLPSNSAVEIRPGTTPPQIVQFDAGDPDLRRAIADVQAETNRLQHSIAETFPTASDPAPYSDALDGCPDRASRERILKGCRAIDHYDADCVFSRCELLARDEPGVPWRMYGCPSYASYHQAFSGCTSARSPDDCLLDRCRADSERITTEHNHLIDGTFGRSDPQITVHLRPHLVALPSALLQPKPTTRLPSTPVPSPSGPVLP